MVRALDVLRLDVNTPSTTPVRAVRDTATATDTVTATDTADVTDVDDLDDDYPFGLPARGWLASYTFIRWSSETFV
jgi:hypothetical protein